MISYYSENSGFSSVRYHFTHFAQQSYGRDKNPKKDNKFSEVSLLFIRKEISEGK